MVDLTMALFAKFRVNKHYKTLRELTPFITYLKLSAILASVAISSVHNTFEQGQRARAQAYWQRLNVAAATYVAHQAAPPTQFSQFVSNSTSITLLLC